MAYASDSTRLPSSGGPVTRALAAMHLEPEPPRRGFLRALAALPLIGGAVGLIGAPTAVAEPVTERLLREYHDWLLLERRRVAQEITGEEGGEPRLLRRSALRWHQAHGLVGASTALPSTRAALVLSAVGCDWRG